MPVCPRTTSPPKYLALCLPLAVLFCVVSPAHGKKKKDRHIFVFDRLELPKDAPAELRSLVRGELHKKVESESKLLSAIPDDAPPYDEKDKGKYGNRPFHRYMAKHHLRAYKVVVEVTEYEHRTEPNPKKSGHVIGSIIKLRLFGETIPDRVMAFAGDGSASVLIEVGKKIRNKDREFADRDAIHLAIADAVATSLKKLDAPPASKKKRRNKKRRNKKRRNKKRREN